MYLMGPVNSLCINKNVLRGCSGEISKMVNNVDKTKLVDDINPVLWQSFEKKEVL